MTNYSDMIGVRGGNPPKTNIAGKAYVLPASTCNLGEGKYCVIDDSMNPKKREEILVALRGYVAPKTRIKKDETADES